MSGSSRKPNDTTRKQRHTLRGGIPSRCQTCDVLSSSLCRPWSTQLRAKDAVPEATGHAEPILVVGEVVLQVVFLELAVVRGEPGQVSARGISACLQRNSLAVVQEVMSQVVADVAKDASTEDRRCRVPTPEEDGVCQLPERDCKHPEQRRRHDQAKLVHREIMMNAVEYKVRRDADPVVWQMAA